MEGLAAASGVAGLLGLAIETGKILQEFTTKVRNAKEEISQMRTDITQLQSTLEQLARFLRSDDAQHHAFDYTRILCASTGNCKDQLESLRLNLQAAADRRLASWKWPLKSSESQRIAQTVRAYSSTFQFALSLDTTSFVAKKSVDLMRVLENEFQRSNDQMQRLESQTTAIQDVAEGTYDIASEFAKSDKTRRILDWISAFDFSRKHKENSRLRVPGTGRWILESREFEEWSRASPCSSRLLWCYGAPGAGKSILTSLIIDTLMENVPRDNTAVIYHYFDNQENEKVTCSLVIRSLLRQLLVKRKDPPEEICRLYMAFGQRDRDLQLEEAEFAFMNVAKSFDQVLVIVDALDEAEVAERSLLITILQKFGSTCKILVTSRPHLVIVSQSFKNEMQLEVKARDSDLHEYLRTRLNSQQNSFSSMGDLSARIIETIVSSASGIFLLAVLHADNVLNEPTIGDAFHALSYISGNLQHTFEKMLLRLSTLQSQSRTDLAKMTLSILTYARRPIYANELCDALTLRLNMTRLDRLFQPSMTTVLECCGGLIVLDSMTKIIHLVHFSLQQYLQDTPAGRHFASPRCIGQLCLNYLSLDDFRSGPCPDEEDIDDRIQSYAFLQYAAHWWGYHVDEFESLRQKAMDLLHSKELRANTVQIYQYAYGLRPLYWLEEEVNSIKPLNFAALYCMHNIAKVLLEDVNNQVNDATEIGTTALMRAASRDDLPFVKMLMARGADPNQSNWYGTTLHCVAEAGCLDTMEYLLQLNLDVDIRDPFGRTPLHCALMEGHLPLVKILLRFGADVDATTDCSSTDEPKNSLNYALESGDTGTIDFFIDYVANSNAKLSHAAKLSQMTQRLRAL